jgi:hypothetical protein
MSRRRCSCRGCPHWPRAACWRGGQEVGEAAASQSQCRRRRRAAQWAQPTWTCVRGDGDGVSPRRRAMSCAHRPPTLHGAARSRRPSKGVARPAGCCRRAGARAAVPAVARAAAASLRSSRDCGTALRGGSARCRLTRACHAAPSGPRKQRDARVKREPRRGRERARREVAGAAAARGGLAIGRAALVRRTSARGRASARGERAAHATRGRRVPFACGTQRGEHARAQSQAHYKQQEGKRDKARGAALAASSSVERRAFRRRTFEAALGRRKDGTFEAALGRRKDGRQSSCASGAQKREE